MAKLGPVMQNGFVVPDWRAAAEHWANTLGVGPFFVVRHVEFAECRYKGEPVEIDMSVAIAYSGDYQVELVQQHNDVPSIYTDFLANNAPGLQHVGTLVDDLDEALDSNGFRDRIVQDGMTTAGQRFAYVDTVLHNGTMLELIETDDAMLGAFAYMRKAAAEWDGSKPIRG
jgi:hypothetical protein